MLLFSLSISAQPGMIDASFGENGKVTTGFGSNNNMAGAVAFQPDGKFVVGGTYISSRGDNDFAIARYNANGSLDVTFGTNGKVATDFSEINSTNSNILSIHVLPGGKLLAVGATAQVLTIKLAVVRYDQDGSIDASFGNNGKIISELTPLDIFGTRIVFQPDGKFIVSATKRYNFDPNFYVGIERYTEDGQPDLTFGTQGQTVASFGNGKSYPSSMALQPDGKIIVAGRYQQTNNSLFSVMRFNANGVLDTTFDADGKLTTSFGSGTSGTGMQVSVNENGKIILAGVVFSNTARQFGLVRYNANGSLDTSFDTDGKATSLFDLEDDYALVNSISRQPDGKYLAVFSMTNYLLTNSNFVVRRYNADASADETFGNQGEISTPFDTGLNEAQFADTAPDGKIVVVGKSVPQSYDRVAFGVARYGQNGAIDPSLDADGKLTTDFEKGNDRLKTLLVLPDDKLIAVGISDYRNANNSTARDIILSKYNSDGSLDATFGNLGKKVSVIGQQLNTVSVAALQFDGKVLIGNMYYNPMEPTYSYELLRYDTTGNLDVSFGNNGKRAIAFYPESIAIQPDGKIVVGGDAAGIGNNNGYLMSRFHNDGSLDTTFSGDGTQFISFGTHNLGRTNVLLQPDGKLILTGTATTPEESGGSLHIGIARFNPNGSPDNSFGDGGIVKTLIDGGCIAYTSFLQPDGKIVVAGKSFGGNINFTSVRYESNGAIDMSYGTNGVSSCALAFDYKEINSILRQADGKFLTVMTLQNAAQDNYDFKIRRFNADGTYDDSFGGTYGVTTSFYDRYDEAFAVGLQSDDRIVVAGSTHNKINYDIALVRYNNAILGATQPGFNAAGVILYPNPVTDVLNVKLEQANEIVDCSIYNLLGQLVFSRVGNHTQIDTRSLDGGIYAISITTTAGVKSGKFVK